MADIFDDDPKEAEEEFLAFLPSLEQLDCACLSAVSVLGTKKILANMEILVGNAKYYGVLLENFETLQ